MPKVVCRDIENNKHEADSSQLRFRPGVYGLLFDGNKILLSKQWDGYDFPGGGIEITETIEDALKREFFEETGLKVEPLKVIHCETEFYRPMRSEKNKGQYWNAIMIYYLVKQVGGQLSDKNFDEEEKKYAAMAEWIDVDKIDENMKFYNGVDSSRLIKDFLKA